MPWFHRPSEATTLRDKHIKKIAFRCESVGHEVLRHDNCVGNMKVNGADPKEKFSENFSVILEFSYS